MFGEIKASRERQPETECWEIAVKLDASSVIAGGDMLHKCRYVSIMGAGQTCICAWRGSRAPPRSLSLVAYIENTVKQWISRPELLPRRLEPHTLVLLDVCSDQLNYETR